ncbi:MAG: 3-deoxy-8-phosphooctulonate synthase, partial [Planctomycetota bacterium]
TQQPGVLGNATAGKREMAPILAKSAVAAGANGLFIEVHPEPEKAKSDAACIIPVSWLEDLLRVCREISELVRG